MSGQIPANLAAQSQQEHPRVSLLRQRSCIATGADQCGVTQVDSAIGGAFHHLASTLPGLLQTQDQQQRRNRLHVEHRTAKVFLPLALSTPQQ